MAILTVSAKGQVTLPVRMRRKLGIQAPDRLLIESVDDAIIIRRPPDLFGLKGFLGKALPAAEERAKMMEAVADHLRGVR